MSTNLNLQVMFITITLSSLLLYHISPAQAEPAVVETPIGVVSSASLPLSTFDAAGDLVYPQLMGNSFWYVQCDTKTISRRQAVGGCKAPLVSTANGQGFAGVVLIAAGKYQVVTGFTSGASYDEILDDTPLPSPPGWHVFYAARAAGKWYGVCDRFAQPIATNTTQPYDEIRAGSLRESPDGSYLAFDARKGEQWGVVVLDVFSHIAPGVQTLAGEHFGFLDVGVPFFQPDSKSFFYISRNKGDCHGNFSRGISTRSYDDIGASAMSRDGMTLVYVVKQQGRWHLGKFGPENALKHTPDGLMVPGQPYVVTEYAPGKAYDELGIPVISPDSGYIAVPARTGASWQIVLAACVGTDEQAGAAYDAVSAPRFSADGKHLLYTAKLHEQWQLVLDGKPIGAPADELRTPLCSADGTHTLVAARQGTQWMLVRDGAAGRAEETMGELALSSDGAHYACVTSRAGVSWVQVDGVNGVPYQGIVHDAVFADGPASFHYYAYRKASTLPGNMQLQLLRVSVAVK